jgi:16S rRNA (guanine527-N7)-methyltransferase
MKGRMKARIESALTKWSVQYEEEQLTRLKRYREILEEWNRKVGLVARGEDVTEHIIDSLRGLPLLRTLPGSLIADAGSGGGFPGIPLAIFEPRRSFVLVERSARKAGFLRYAAAAVAGLDNVEVADRTLEELDPGFDGVVFRALGELKRYVDVLLGITRPAGWLLGYKGRFEIAAAELNELEIRGASAEIVPAPLLTSTETGTRIDGGSEKERTFLIVRKH